MYLDHKFLGFLRHTLLTPHSSYTTRFLRHTLLTPHVSYATRFYATRFPYQKLLTPHSSYAESLRHTLLTPKASYATTSYATDGSHHNLVTQRASDATCFLRHTLLAQQYSYVPAFFPFLTLSSYATRCLRMPTKTLTPLTPPIITLRVSVSLTPQTLYAEAFLRHNFPTPQTSYALVFFTLFCHKRLMLAPKDSPQHLYTSYATRFLYDGSYAIHHKLLTFTAKAAYATVCFTPRASYATYF